MGDLEEEKIALILQRDKLKERLKTGEADSEENERIKKEIKEIHAKIEEINKKLRDEQLGVE